MRLIFAAVTAALLLTFPSDGLAQDGTTELPPVASAQTPTPTAPATATPAATPTAPVLTDGPGTPLVIIDLPVRVTLNSRRYTDTATGQTLFWVALKDLGSGKWLTPDGTWVDETQDVPIPYRQLAFSPVSTAEPDYYVVELSNDPQQVKPGSYFVMVRNAPPIPPAGNWPKNFRPTTVGAAVHIPEPSSADALEVGHPAAYHAAP